MQWILHLFVSIINFPFIPSLKNNRLLKLKSSIRNLSDNMPGNIWKSIEHKPQVVDKCQYIFTPGGDEMNIMEMGIIQLHALIF